MLEQLGPRDVVRYDHHFGKVEVLYASRPPYVWAYTGDGATLLDIAEILLESYGIEQEQLFLRDKLTAWDSISDAFDLLEVLRSRIDRTEWSALQAQLLDAIPRALDAQPRPTPRPKLRRRMRRKSRSIYI